MSYHMFYAKCEHCWKRSEEYSNFPHCRECNAHVCDACSTNEDAETGRADCHRCAGEILDDEEPFREGPDTEFGHPIKVRGMKFRDEDDAHDYFVQREIDEAP